MISVQMQMGSCDGEMTQESLDPSLALTIVWAYCSMFPCQRFHSLPTGDFRCWLQTEINKNKCLSLEIIVIVNPFHKNVLTYAGFL